eukprot:c15397_g1_i1 orf=243-1157(-)
MEDAAKMELRHWANFDQTYLKDLFRNQQSSTKLDEVLCERDAAIAERDAAIAEKKSADADRDSALLQRDIAYADRHAAWVERDSVLEALTMIQANESSLESASKLTQVVNIPVDRFPVGSNLLCLPTTLDSMNSNNIETKPRVKQRVKKAEKEMTRKGKDSGAESQAQKGSKVSRKRRKQQDAPAKGEKIKREDVSKSMVLYVAPIDMSLTATPFCSCTGANRQCYRWGRGGWQSSCCTNFLSEYPLPMNHAKSGCRVAGRKMSGGAFKKVLERLAGDGVDITQPIDMKDHWAKHGTNRYIVIR